MPRPRSVAAALLLPLALSACAPRGARRGVGSESAVLEVRNSYLGPVTLYAIRDGGIPQRVGQATSSRPQRFTLGPAVIGGSGALRIVAVPLAENGRANTGVITVRPGDLVQFNVGSNLAASTVFIS